MEIITNLKFNSGIFKFSNKYIFYKFLDKLLIIFFIYIKMSKTLSAKYYQEKKKAYKKKTSFHHCMFWKKIIEKIKVYYTP